MTLQLVRLEVSAFKAIARADVTFGPGLTVLHGPNDLGKSTLVLAMRAALLLPAASSEGETFLPWYSDQTPRVVLTLRDDQGFWRVTKAFGRDDVAELQTSKDESSWALKAKGRQVDELLRARLGWGTPEFKGKSGPRGMPSSFLANALLGAQSGVDELLSQSLKSDPSETGRQTLTRALSVLAQDPLFKAVLDQAQAEVKTYFSDTGQRRRGAASPFKKVSDEVKVLSDELERVTRDLDEAKASERRVEELQRLHAQALSREQEARLLLAQAHEALRLSERRAALEAAVTDARARLATIDGHQSKARALDTEARAAEERRAIVEARARAAGQATDAAARAHAQAETHLAAAQSGDAERAAALEVARRTATRAQLEAECARLEATKADLTRALALETDRLQKQQALRAAQTDVTTLEATREKASERLATAAEQARLAQWLLDYGQWKQAERALASQETAAERSGELARQVADGKAALEAQEAALGSQRAELDANALPQPDVVTAVRELWAKKTEADAHAGGGLSVVVKPKEPLRLHVEADDDAPVDEARLSAERLIDAERRVTLSIGHLVDIEVTAGRKEQRAMADLLSKRWKKEGLPVLVAAGVSSVKELEAAVERRRGQLEALERQALTLEAARQKLSMLEAQAALVNAQGPVVTRDELARRRDRIPPEQLTVIATMFPGLGSQWEAEATKLVEQARLQESKARDEVSRTDASLAAERARVTAMSEALAALPPAPKEGPGPQLDALDKTLQQRRAVLAQLDAELVTLEKTRGSQVKVAETALAHAAKALEGARAAQGEAEAALLEAQTQAVEARTRATSQAELAAGLDRVAAEATLRDAEATFAPVQGLAVPTPELLAQAEALVAAAEQDQQAAFARVSQEQGVLGRIAGPSVKERHAQLTEALAVAKQKEQQVELDARAWQVLRDTLREAENAQTAHLGQALTGPLSTRFSQLTGGRYGTVRIDPHLQVEGLSVRAAATGEDDVVAALSVGTKDQLATLLRLVLAKQLGMPLVLDDHLVHTDTTRLKWFRALLNETALETQVLVFTCREQDYLAPGVSGGPGGQLTVVDLAKAITPWPERLSSAS
ncbi:MAG: AAA family ATPase [Myxococcaceae bacterium]|nr:AAA family ATPase [Myxococcaceae bacterium]